MSTVLAELLAEAHKRARALPAARGPRVERRPFAAAIAGKDTVSVVAEFKRRSPSENAIAENRDLKEQVTLYASAGAAAISVLTEPTRFGGSTGDLQRAARAVDVPLLMKDFIVSARQVQHAARLGASACLLIVRCLEPAQLTRLAGVCRDEGLAALVECHDRSELEHALALEDAVIGVNNRDLDDLTVDVTRAGGVLRDVPPERVTIAESGYDQPSQIRALRGTADAVLIGTMLMRSGDPAGFLRESIS